MLLWGDMSFAYKNQLNIMKASEDGMKVSWLKIFFAWLHFHEFFLFNFNVEIMAIYLLDKKLRYEFFLKFCALIS